MSDKHALHYLLLLLGLSIFGFFFVYFRYDQMIQIMISALASIFYVGWGITHHALEGRLTSLIAFEYILFGSLTFLLVFTVLYL